MSRRPHSDDQRGWIGPNAITRVAEALRCSDDAQSLKPIFLAAGLGRYLLQEPSSMMLDFEVTTLHQIMRKHLGLSRARSIGREAGIRTADYLLANRIPVAAQFILSRLPPALGSRLLVNAISRNSWTFTGSGDFEAEFGSPLRLKITKGPLSRYASADEPVCDFYAGTFERLFSVLIDARTKVSEVECEALGDPACVFEVEF